ncbi:hypothetical protein [Geodermatophilus sp. DSM 45219]|uniref:hypothetical protein n=1 Tax=Geodermatophilus sp. DSM 45219 TaxID=1881103 RepID=UPI0008895922|nr:hypothetical protein [Geodermatophilus sp. DSM 45219]SDN55347.1 hypothetical protein SAMN05428965_0906 [Geodermatophilus sp. DSM 45219]
MTSLTLITVAVVVFGVVNPRGYGRALALGGATPVGAAVVVGGIAVPTFYAVAIGAAVGLVVRLLLRTRSQERLPDPPAPGVRLLVAFAAWAVLVTLLAPYLFPGLEGLTPNGGRRLDPGLLSQSNIAQSVYLVLGVCVVVFLSRSRWAGPEVIGTAVGVPVVLSLWAYLGTFGVPFPAGFFDNSPNFAFIQTAPGGVERFRGILSEPSGLGGTCLVAIAYMSARARQVQGARRVGVLAVVAVAAYLGFISTSATFVVAGVVLVVIAGLVSVARLVLRRGPLSLASFSLAWVAAIAALWFLPLLVNLFEQVVDDKVASDSYTQRSGADSYSFGLVWDTFGLGMGLGSNRPSSFVATLLSTVGVVGAALFVAVVWVLLREGYALGRARPVVWALVGVLITKVIAGPDLNDTNGLTWMSLGVLAHAALSARRARASTSGATAVRPVSTRARAGVRG